MKRFLSHLTISDKTIPAALLALCVAVLGLLSPTLGFYWDDWAKILVSRVWGLAGYWAYYAEDRPLSAWTHILFTPLLGGRPLAWVLFQLGLVWLSAWGLYLLIKAVWPKAGWQAAAAAVIFVAYPVFVQYGAAVTFHQQWLQFVFYFFSLWLMLKALRVPARRVLYTGLALLLMLLQLSITEYFVPLELMRPLLLWIGISQQFDRGEKTRAGKSLRPVLLTYAPYLLLFAAYVVYRLFFIRLSGEDPYQATTLTNLLSDPAGTLIELLRVIVQDSVYSLVTVWTQVWNVGRIETVIPFNGLALAVSALAGAAVFVYLFLLSKGQEIQKGWSGQAMAAGLLAVALGLAPAWLTGREVVFDFHSNRYALPAMFGAALFFAGVLDWLTPQRLQKALLAAVLVGLGTNVQLRAANDYRWAWREQRSFFWQLYWRAPSLEPGTALVFMNNPFPDQGMFSMSAALNLLYPQTTPHPGGPDDYLPYWIYSLLPRYDLNKLPDPLQIGFSTQFRSLIFKGSTPDSLLVSYDLSKGSCIWVLRDEDKNDPFLPQLLKETLAISNLSQIGPQPDAGWSPPAEMFGPEPERTWCYYFQKAELAHQNSDWDAITALGDEARSQGYSPEDSRSNSPREWLAFIEAYLHTGQYDAARQISGQAFTVEPHYAAQLCGLWQSAGIHDPDGEAALQAAGEEMQCNLYP